MATNKNRWQDGLGQPEERQEREMVETIAHSIQFFSQRDFILLWKKLLADQNLIQHDGWKKINKLVGMKTLDVAKLAWNSSCPFKKRLSFQVGIDFWKKY